MLPSLLKKWDFPTQNNPSVCEQQSKSVTGFISMFTSWVIFTSSSSAPQLQGSVEQRTFCLV